MSNKKHIVVDRKTKDLVMHFICDFHASSKENTYINADSLTHAGLPPNTDKEHVLAVLESEGYINYHKPTGFPTKRIDLTPAGKCYFERKNEIRAKEQKDSIRYWITTAVAILALLLSLMSLANQVGVISLPTP